jgi:hypothetical protein
MLKQKLKPNRAKKQFNKAKTKSVPVCVQTTFWVYAQGMYALRIIYALLLMCSPEGHTCPATHKPGTYKKRFGLMRCVQGLV